MEGKLEENVEYGPGYCAVQQVLHNRHLQIALKSLRAPESSPICTQLPRGTILFCNVGTICPEGRVCHHPDL